MQRISRSKTSGKALSLLSAVFLFAMLIAPLSMPSSALADGGDFSLDFAASDPSTYDHSTGGGFFGDPKIAVESLEGGDFACQDVVTFLTQIVVDGSAAAGQTIEIDYTFAGVNVGQAGIGYYEVVGVQLNTGDTAYQNADGNESVTLSSVTPPTNPFQNGATDLLATVQVAGLDAGDEIVIRIDVRVGCAPDADPTGNLHANIGPAAVIAPPSETTNGDINVGKQEITMKSLSNFQVAEGSITIVKDAQPESSQQFDFTGDLGTFSLIDDGSSTDTEMFSGLSPNAYTVSETVPGGWDLTNISCTGDTDDGSVVNSGSVDIDLDDGEDITCTFTNVQQAPATITVTKTADPTSVAEPGGPVEFTVLIENDSSEVSVTIDTLDDDVFGDIADAGNQDIVSTTCTLNQTIVPSGNYECTFVAEVNGQPADSPHVNTVTASGEDQNGNDVSDSDTATVTITDVPSSILVNKDATPDTVAEPGGTVTFSVSITNTSTVDDVTIDSITDDIYGDLASGANPDISNSTCDDLIGDTLAPGATTSCSFDGAVSGNAGSSHTDVVTVNGTDDDNNPVSANDDATVTITDVPSSINVVKTATPDTIAEPGGNVTFNVTVNNTSAVDSVTINTLSDSIYGDLNGQGTCAVPQNIAPGASYSCSFTVNVSGNVGDVETDVVTASGVDDDGQSVSDSDDATVTILDVVPAVNIVKAASPSELPEPGGPVTFSFVVTNTSADETITITSLVDSIYGDLNGQGNCAVGAVLAPGQQYNCAFTTTVTGGAGDVETNVVTITAVDDEQNEATDSDTATVLITDVPSSVNIVKTANPTTVPSTGGDVTYTFTITNTSLADAITVDQLDDSIYGSLDGQGTCSLPQTLNPGEQYTCSLTVLVTGEPGETIVNVAQVVAIDDDGIRQTDSDDAVVDIDEAPQLGQIIITKQAAPDDGITAFSFAGPGTLGDSLLSGQSNTETLDPGTYTVIENIDDVGGAWVLDTIVCGTTNGQSTISTNVADGSVTIDLAAGDTVECTFFNVQQPSVVIPEAPLAILFPIIGLLVAGAGYLVLRRRDLFGQVG